MILSLSVVFIVFFGPYPHSYMYERLQEWINMEILQLKYFHSNEIAKTGPLNVSIYNANNYSS